LEIETTLDLKFLSTPVENLDLEFVNSMFRTKSLYVNQVKSELTDKLPAQILGVPQQGVRISFHHFQTGVKKFHTIKSTETFDTFKASAASALGEYKNVSKMLCVGNQISCDEDLFQLRDGDIIDVEF